MRDARYLGMLAATLLEDPKRDDNGMRTVLLRLSADGMQRTARIRGLTDHLPFEKGDEVYCEAVNGSPSAGLDVRSYRGKSVSPSSETNREIHARLGGDVRIVAGNSVITVGNDGKVTISGSDGAALVTIEAAGEISVHTDSSIKAGKSGGTFDKLMAYTGAASNWQSVQLSWAQLLIDINIELALIEAATAYGITPIATPISVANHKATDNLEASREA
jgi:hypothetical protein